MVRRALSAVVAADSEGSLSHPEQWAQLLGEIDGEQTRIQWVVVPPAERDRFLGELGDFSSAKRLITFARHGPAMISAEMRAQRAGASRQSPAASPSTIPSSAARCRTTPAERPKTPTALEPFKRCIIDPCRPPAYSQDLQHRGFPLGICQLRRYVALVRAPRSRKGYLRIETDPGERAQVDWGSFGHIRIGTTQRPVSVFSMEPHQRTLSHRQYAAYRQAHLSWRMASTIRVGPGWRSLLVAGALHRLLPRPADGDRAGGSHPRAASPMRLASRLSAGVA